MNKMLIDTCVWLDLAKDHKQRALLSVIEELIKMEELSIIVPITVVDEFKRNKVRIVNEIGKGVTDNFNRVKEDVNKLGDPLKKQEVIAQLNDVAHKIPILGESAIDTIARIEKIFKSSIIVETSKEIKLAAVDRAIQGLAPFHRQKNSMNDAIIFETYKYLLSRKDHIGIRFCFVTHNKKDFSKPNGNEKEPHPDFAEQFSKIKSRYFINLAEAVHKIRPELVSDLMMENEWIEEPRSFTEILSAENELREKIWYNRHHNWLYQIKKGKHKIVESTTTGKYDPTVTPQYVYDGAIKSAKRIESKYGLKNLGPWDDFEWGMMNGKLSALRWVTGDEWDFLDT